MTEMRIPARLAARCKLGLIMHNRLGYEHLQGQIDAAIAANVVGTMVDKDGRVWTQVRELDYGKEETA